MNSSMPEYRSSSFLAMAFMTTPWSAGGTWAPGLMSFMLGTASWTCAMRMFTEFGRSNGTFPVSIS